MLPSFARITLASFLIALAGFSPLLLAADDSAHSASSLIPLSQIGAKASADYHGRAVGIEATADGARLHTAFQKLAGSVTPEGLWLESMLREGGRLHVVADRVGRAGIPNSNAQIPRKDQGPNLSPAGSVSVGKGTVSLVRPGLVEEYSVSVDGVRQDFVVMQRPSGSGGLCVELALSGARAEAAAYGAKVTLDESGRVLAYSKLKAVDAKGRELAARMQIKAAHRLRICVDDAGAAYPVRIDPTFSDANWISLNPGIPGATATGTSASITAEALDSSGNLYVGGTFTFIGTVAANHVAKWNGSTWSALGAGVSSGTTVAVNALVVDGTRLYVGGLFTTAGTTTVSNIAAWDGTNWSALGAGTGGTVLALAADGAGDLYVGGSFTTPSLDMAMWNNNTGTWSALSTGTNGAVDALAYRSGVLYAGGAFGTAGGVTASRIASWDGSKWSPLGSGTGGGANTVLALAFDNSGNLYVGGAFTTAGGSGASFVAEWTTGGSWSPLGSGVSGRVSALAADGFGNVYAGGSFATAGAGVPVNQVAKWSSGGWSALSTGVSPSTSSVSALVVDSSGNLYAGGNFTAAGGVGASAVAEWNGSNWSALGSGINNSVSALALDSSGNLYAGGTFTTAGTTAANDIAMWNGTTWSPLGSGMNGQVNALVLDNLGNLYAGGAFTTAGGTTVNRVAMWNGTAWAALGSGVSGIVMALAVDSSNNLYVGGQFTSANGTLTVNHIAEWSSGSWIPLAVQTNIGTNSTVNALAIDGSNNLYAGGQFTTAGGVPANDVAKWNPSANSGAGAWFALGTGLNSNVNALVCDTFGNLYVGGFFTTAGGVTVNRVAEWIPSANSGAGAWLAFGQGLNNQVTALALDAQNNVYAAGSFTGITGGATANNIAEWNGSAWVPMGSGLNAGALALAMDKTRQRLYIGGSFTFAGTTASPFIAAAAFTEGPTLSSPANNTTTSSPVSVVFNLPEAALPGTVQLSFGGNVLTLASTQEIAGTHVFSFDPANPTASPQVAGGSLIPDGTYTVTLSYQDTNGDPIASVSTTNVTIDTATQPPVLISPSTSTVTNSPVNVSFTLPETGLVGSVTLSFGSNVLVLDGSSATAGTHNFSFDPSNPTATPQIAIGSAIPDGTYAVTLSYQDVVRNPAASATSTNVTIDTTTLPPTLTAPAPNAVSASPVSVSFTLPEAALPGSVQLSFSSTVFVLATSQESAGTHSFTFDPGNPTASPQILSGSPLPNGTYDVTFSYQDVFANPVATVTNPNFNLGSNITQAPTLSTPAANDITSTPVSVSFILPQTAKPGSVKLGFGGHVLTLASSQETTGTHSFTFSTANPTSAPEIASGGAIPDGVYAVTLSYQDLAGDPAASTSSNVTLDTTTQKPTLNTPSVNTVTSSPVNVSIFLPEAAGSGTVQLSFGANVLTLASTQETVGVHNFTFNPANPTASPQILSGGPIPDGTYTVTLTYQDALFNPAVSSTSAANVTIDTTTQPPTLTAPATNATVTNPVSVSFSLPETAKPGTVHLGFGATVLTLASSQESAGSHSFTFNPINPTASPQIAGGSLVPTGNYTVTLSYQDALGNPAASASSTNVTVNSASNNAGLSALSLTPAATLSPVFSTGTPSYTTAVHFGTTSVTVTPTAAESHATIKVNNITVASGNASGPISLNVGSSNTLTTVVTAQDGVTQQTYTVNVTRQSNLQDWRQNFFGSTANSGNGANTADQANDGIPNLIKFATNLDPTMAEPQPGTIVASGSNLVFTYPRSDAAMADGLTFTVQWSSTLPGTSWSNTGVTEQILSDDGTTQQVKALVPIGSNGSLFVRLTVGTP